MLLGGCLLAGPKPAPGTRAGSAEMHAQAAVQAGAAAGREGHSPALLAGTSQEAVDAQSGFIMGLSSVRRLV